MSSALAAEAKKAAGKVNVYMYSEYIDPEIPKEFEKKTGIKVQIDVYEAAEEMVAKMQQGGVSQYDVVVAPNHWIPVLKTLKLIQPLDKAKIPNYKNIDTQFSKQVYDPDDSLSAPYQWGTIGLIYRKDKVKNFVPSWKSLFDETSQPQGFYLMDEMRPMMSAALISLGKGINTKDSADLKAAGEKLLKAKTSKKCLGLAAGVDGKNKVVAGDAALALVYNGDAVRGMAENDKVDFVVPEEGTMIWVDCMTLSAKAPNAAAAHQFIDYILDPKVGAQLSNFNRYATPNKASLAGIKDEDKKNTAIYPTPDQMKKLQYLQDLGKDNQLYDEIWTSVKSK
ncbi:TPA: polyamine ABC transporter substrate-binding protein [Candidatus Sumerlaeota bacterium]|nr:polyamine ABC transporter substrate-binding protein [Candidatus Sumerlaeota bacterium]